LDSRHPPIGGCPGIFRTAIGSDCWEVGFACGLVGGMTAMPGAVPTLWCDLHGVPRLEQRGIVQPFMLVIPVAAILLLLQAPDSDAPYWNTWPLFCRPSRLALGSA
jgi:hypothetical protein